MNSFAFKTTGLAIRALTNISRARFRIHGRKNIPLTGPVVFAVNHFTRIETLFFPYHVHRLTNRPVWSLADHTLFTGPLKSFLDRVGAVSTKNPHRDLLIVKSLLMGDVSWVVFPEGRMVKSKKLMDKGRFMVSAAGYRHPPHTGAASLPLRAEFYRRRLSVLAEKNPAEAERLAEMFDIPDLSAVSTETTRIVPTNITYYPIRARENLLSSLAEKMVDDLPDRALDELMTEGAMLTQGVDVDIRFGPPILAADYLEHPRIRKDMATKASFDFDDPIPCKSVMQRRAIAIMNRYMTDIYSLTTVNPDHIFAGLLSKIPKKRIREWDFLLRAFCAMGVRLHCLGVHVHSSLAENPVPLLTDDRYARYDDFISLAMEKQVVKKEGEFLVINTKKLPGPPDFHRVRIDNPVAVMANEVEPLSGLQSYLRRLAWTPAFLLRQRVAARLLQKAETDFLADYKAYFVEGESKPQEVGRPFLIRGRRNKPAVLLIHGYMAAPMEVRNLARHLGKRGHEVFVPRLKGHGTSPKDLARHSFRDWRLDVEEGFALLSCRKKQVVVGGFSTGAGLALDLAARSSNVSAVFAICPPLRLQDLSAKFVPVVDTWNKLMEKVHLEGARMEFVDNHPENPHINYFKNPISGVRELDRLMEEVEEALERITVPGFVVQADNDPVVDPKGSMRLFRRMGAKDKSYLLVHAHRHGIVNGPESVRVFSAVDSFLESLSRLKTPESPPAAAPPDEKAEADSDQNLISKESEPSDP